MKLHRGTARTAPAVDGEGAPEEVGLAPVREVGTAAHERLDGSGYHRQVSGEACRMPARILAAADVYHALTEPRRHRPAWTPEAAARQLGDLATERRLCPDAVGAVLAAAGQPARRGSAAPDGLTDREVEVLRLVARGLTNREVAVDLDISAKTAGRHLEHVFGKIGVTTRAAAAMWVMQRGLVG